MTRTEGGRHLLRVLLLVVVACLAAEAAATLALRRMVPTNVEPRGPEEALLKALGPASRGPYVLVLGDSVMKDGPRERGPLVDVERDLASRQRLPAVSRSLRPGEPRRLRQPGPA